MKLLISEENLINDVFRYAQLYNIPLKTVSFHRGLLQNNQFYIIIPGFAETTHRNISLHVRLLALPKHLRDTVILHELTHLEFSIEEGHSALFWKALKKKTPILHKFDDTLYCELEQAYTLDYKYIGKYPLYMDCKFINIDWGNEKHQPLQIGASEYERMYRS